LVYPEGELMAKYRITGPDGGTYEVTAPDGASEAEVLAYVQKNAGASPAPAASKPEPSVLDSVKQGLGNLTAGAVRGAGSIGATLVDLARSRLGDPTSQSIPANLRPQVTHGLAAAPRGAELRSAMDAGLTSAGADPTSLAYQGGKLGAEIAGTAGVGGMLGKGVQGMAQTRAMSGLEPIVEGVAKGLQTGGFRVGPLAGTGMGTAARVATGAATGGAAAGMVNPEDAGLGAAIGGALPGVTQLAGNAGAAIRRGMAPEVAPEVRQLAQRAQELGIRIPADRLTNSRPLNAVASALNYVPGSGRAATEEAMSSQLNQALSKTFGQNTSNVTQALRKADDALGGQFDKFLQTNKVRVDQQFMDDLAQAANQASKELGSDGATIIGNQIDEILAKASTGEIDGQAAYNIKKTLDRIGKRNTPEAFYALELKGKLMDALNRSVGEQKAKGFQQLRQQYGSMLELQKLAKNGAEGEISVARLANMKNIRNSEMQDLADIAAQFIKPREGQHGAAQRAMVGAAGAMTGGIPGLLGGMAVGRGANMLLNSNAARNSLLAPQRMLGEPEALGLLTQGAYRALPLLPAE
jgi:hypothetical protein